MPWHDEAASRGAQGRPVAEAVEFRKNVWSS